MVPEIKYLHCPEIYDLKSYIPPEPENFSFLLQAMIGPKGENSHESFDIVVCTPQWIMNNNKRNAIIIGRHYLIVFEYNYFRIVEFLEKFLRTCEGENWREIAIKVSRIGQWEFEDYVE